MSNDEIIGGPHAELSFYLPMVPEREALVRLIQANLALGAGLWRRIIVDADSEARQSNEGAFQMVSDLTWRRLNLKDVDIAQLLTDPSARVLKAFFSDTTSSDTLSEIATFSLISEAAVGRDCHPIVLYGDGEEFCGPPNRKPTRRSLLLGLRLYNKLLSLVGILQPSYASLTVEYSLECCFDLRQDPRSLAFNDFWISRQAFGDTTADRIAKMYSDAYTEEASGGVYVSTGVWFNPARKQIDSIAAMQRSAEVAEIIAQRCQIRKTRGSSFGK